MTIERIDLALDVKAAGERGEIEGIAWAPGPDRAGDVIAMAAFAGAALPLPMLDCHDGAQPVGAWTSLAIGAAGLTVKGRLLVDDVQRARELHALVKAGGLRGLSIGFETKASTPRPGGGRNITALNLLEISLVAIPCHPGARVTAAKAASPEAAVPAPEDQIETTTEATVTPEALAEVGRDVAEAVARLAGVETRLAAAETRAARPFAAAASADEKTALERKSLMAYLRSGSTTMTEIERKTLSLSAGGNPVGSVVAPPELSSEMLRERLEFSPFRGLVSARSTVAPSVDFPRRTGRTNAAWRGENTAATASEPGFALESIAVKELATFCDLSANLLDDAPFVMAELAMAVGEDFGLKESAAIAAGNGVLAPLGILAAGSSVARVPSGHASQLTGDGLINTLYALQASYRNRGSWVMNGATLAAIRKMKGSDGQYVWQRSLAEGQPETILGRPVVESIDMPDIAAGADAIIFGDFATAYRLIDRRDVTLLVDPFTRATEGVIRVHATTRLGGKTVMPSALRVVRIAAS